MLRTRSEAIRVWDRANDAFRVVTREPAFVDEGPAGTIMASHFEAQRRNVALTADLKAARKSLNDARQNAKDVQKANDIQDKQLASLKSELEAAVAARDEAQAEIEQLKASNRQLLTTSGQGAAEAAMVELKRQLDLANQQLAERGSAESVRALTERCKELETSLQLSDQRLRETRDAGGLTLIQNQLDVALEERDRALKREQELLAEGWKLEAQYNELKLQQATTKAEVEAKLRVADIELGSKQSQYQREHEFAQDQKAEVERLKSELKEVWEELKAEWAKLADLQTQISQAQAQVPPVQTMAQYQTMPPGQFQGSPMQAGTMPQGHYSPTVVPYAVATNVTASPGQVSTLAGFSYQGTPAQAPPVHGSPQVPGQPFFMRQPMLAPQGTQLAQLQQMQSQPEDPVVSSAGPTK